MFVTRTISGAILLAITICAIVCSGPLLYIFMLAVSVIGMFELYRVFKMEKTIPAIIGYLTAVVINSLILGGRPGWCELALTGGFLVIMGVYVITWPKFRFDNIMQAVFGIIYVAFMLSFIFRIRMYRDGAYTVWLIFISAWGCDTCAYLAGRAFGKRKMAPMLSPKKSVEGAIGGVIGCALLGLIYGLVFASHLREFSYPWLSCMLIAAVGGPVSMIGDLAASAIKRNHDIKDYGSLIPGHGGIMDRFDSVIFTAPSIYILVVVLQALPL